MSDRDSWSTYDAKARFSELLRLVREGRTITVTYHGKPVAEVRPLAAAEGMEARLERLRSRGLLSLPDTPSAPLEPLASRPGALARFLQDRGE
ncbi:MAG: type II toxin-antitoxin system prevent-host-death family antitoxin [Gemmatimonadota bacterium]